MFLTDWKKFLGEVRTELKRTTWPSRLEVRNTTLVVIVTVFIFAAFLGVVDYILSHMVRFILSAFTQ